MSDDPSTEAGVKRELLQLALHNSTRSVLLQVAAVTIIVIFGVSSGRAQAATIAGALGVFVAAWRLWISLRYRVLADVPNAGLRRLEHELEGNAALAGVMWCVATFGIYPALSGTTGTTYVGMVLGSIAVASFFMTLVGRSFAILALFQLTSLVLVSLISETVRSVPVAALVAIFGLTVYRASHESIVFGLYTTAEAAREHCETLMRREEPNATFDWIEDEEEGVAELAATIDADELVTGYVVTALTVASAYDPEVDE